MQRPPDSIAFRRELIAGTLVFVITYLPALAAIEYFYIHQMIAKHDWWLIIPAIGHGLLLPFLLAGGLALGMLRSLQWWHHRQGIYRCYRCGGPKPMNGFCPCLLAADPKLAQWVARRDRLPSRFWRHVRQQLRRRGLPIALVLILPAILIALNLPARNTDPFWLKLVTCYAGLHMLLGAFGIVLMEGLSPLHVARRLRIRFDLILRMTLLAGFVLVALAVSLR